MRAPEPARKDGPRINEEIRVREVHLIDKDGTNKGTVQIADALAAAQEAGLDLVEISPNANPPIVKILDYGKYKYQEQKKAAEARKKQKVVEIKEIKLRPMIDDHDYDVKMRSIQRFFEEGDKVKVTLRFRGREMAHQEFGFQVVERFIKSLAPYGHPDAPAKLVGRSINLMFSPLPRNKRARHPNQAEGAAGGAGPHSPPEPPEAGRVAPISVVRPDTPAGPNSKPASGFANNPFSGLGEKLDNS